MVENNDNNDATTNDQTGKEAPRKRVRLFGGRKPKTQTPPAPVESAPVTDAPGAEKKAPLAEKAPAVETPAAEKAPAAEKTPAREAASAEGTKAPAKSPRARAAAKAAPAEDSAKPKKDDETSKPAEAEAPLKQNRPPLTTSLLFQAPDLPTMTPPSRGGSGSDQADSESSTVRRRARRRSGDDDSGENGNVPSNTVVKVRQPRQQPEPSNEPQRVRGSTRLEAKKQRRRDGRDAGRRRPVITEAEFLARRESVDRAMVVRQKNNRIQIGVLEDGVLVEHYVAQSQEASLIGNVYLGRVQNVLPSMEAAFVDIGRGRNAVLYSGEVDWEAAAENSADGKSQARRIELALKPGDKVLVQVTKDPVGHKGARLTSQVSLPGRYLVYVPNGSMNGISRKLPDTERSRLKRILKEVLPENTGVIVRTAAEGATEEQLTLDVNRLTSQWTAISKALENVSAPALLHSEPDLLVKIVRDVFNEDFHRLIIEGDDAKETISTYLAQVAPDLVDRIQSHEGDKDSFDEHRITEQIEKALDRKVWLPSGGSLVIDRTEAMTVVDVNTGKFVGSGGNLEETVTKNNLEAAEEIVRQLRLRDIGGIIVVDFIDMVLESNRDLVLRRLVECLSRDRTKHQVAEVTSLGLVQMTRKKLGLGLIESFSEPCETCAGRGIIIHHDPVVKHRQSAQPEVRRSRGGRGNNNSGNSGGGGGSNSGGASNGGSKSNATHAITEDVKNALAQIAASTIAPSNGAVDAAAEEAVSAVQASAAADGSAGDSSQKVTRSGGRRSRSKADAPLASADGDAPKVDAESGKEQSEKAAPPEKSAAPEQTAGSEKAAQRSKSGTRSRAKKSAASEGPAVPEETRSAPVEGIAELFDMPVTKPARAQRRVSNEDAEQILGSVLDALPQPKQPGEGRARVSRRASSSGVVQAGTAETVTAEPASE